MVRSGLLPHPPSFSRRSFALLLFGSSAFLPIDCRAAAGKRSYEFLVEIFPSVFICLLNGRQSPAATGREARRCKVTNPESRPIKKDRETGTKRGMKMGITKFRGQGREFSVRWCDQRDDRLYGARLKDYKKRCKIASLVDVNSCSLLYDRASRYRIPIVRWINERKHRR